MPAPETSLQLDRRTFCLGAAVCGMALACGCGGGGGGISAAAPPPPPPAGGVTTSDSKAAMLANPDGTVHDYRSLANFFLVRDAAGIYAMTAICTHQGCTVDLPAGTKITCPCHGSQYDLSGGNLLGPAVTPLVHFAVTEAAPGGALVVHVDQVVAASARLA